MPEGKNKEDSSPMLSKNMVILIAIILVVTTAIIVYFIAKPNNIGKISGNIFATMQSGDVKRAAGIEVCLIKDENSFMDAFQKMQETCRNEVEAIIFDKDYHAGYGGEEDFKRKLHVDQIIAVCHAKLREFLQGNTVQKATTDVNGLFEFSNVPFGNYYVFSQFEVFTQKLEWLEPVDLKSKEVKMDLSNLNKRLVIEF